MSRWSTFAGSSFSPDRMLRSMTAPVSKFLNFVRVNAAPFPGFTNWNSMTVNGFPSISTLRPLRISDVSYMAGDVYPAHQLGVKPVSTTLSRREQSSARQHLPRHVRCAIPRTVDQAAHYRNLAALGRDEFLASAAPAAFVRFRALDVDEGSIDQTLSMDSAMDEVDETMPIGKVTL